MHLFFFYKKCSHFKHLIINVYTIHIDTGIIFNRRFNKARKQYSTSILESFSCSSTEENILYSSCDIINNFGINFVTIQPAMDMKRRMNATVRFNSR